MKVSIVGTGYVGLVTGVCLAEKGHQVICVDIDSNKVKKINEGITPIYEVGLEEMLRRNLVDRVKATTDLADAVQATDVTMIAVGTPFQGNKIDLTFVKRATKQIGAALKQKLGYHVVVVKSTVVPGTTENVVLPLLESYSGKSAGQDFGVGMNPEFLTEGEAVEDFMKPDRIVLGGIDERSIEVMSALYQGFAGVPRIRTNPSTAEMIKYASNTLLATMISFSNELANLSSKLEGVDIVDVLQGVHTSRYLSVPVSDNQVVHPAIVSFLGAGCGFGGSCLPKDTSALIAHGQQHRVDMPLLRAVRRINENQPKLFVGLLSKHFRTLKGVKVAVLGLAFRPGTDDVRESPAIPIIKELLSKKAVVKAHDPIAIPNAKKMLGAGKERVTFAATLAEAVEGAQAILVITRWKEFEKLSDLVAGVTPPPLVLDGRRMMERGKFVRYDGVGLGKRRKAS